jgi:hypothetical protein
MDEPISKFVLLVPLKYNDGSDVPPDVILDFQEALFALAGGFTVAGTVEGAYLMEDGNKQVDHSLQIWVGIEETCLPELERLVAELGAKLGQESMYLERTGGVIRFVPPQPPGGA